MMTISKAKMLAFSLITIFILLGMIFLIGEVVMRGWFFNEHQLSVKYHTNRGTEILCTYSNNPKLIYEYKKKTNGTNSQGYMDKEHAFIKKAGTLRIVVIGDSIAEGYGVGYEKSFPRLIEKSLSTLLKKEVEVIILARTGYSLSQELELLEKEAFLYSPNLVIWSYCLNDPANPIYHFDHNNEIGRYLYRPKSYFFAYMAMKFFYLRERIVGRNANKEYHQFLHDVYRNDVEKGIKKIGELSQSHHVPVVFLINPIFEKNNDFKRYSCRNIHTFLARTAKIHGIYVLDLLEPLMLYRPNEVKCEIPGWRDPWHPNEKGHKLISDFVVERILLLKLIQ